MRNLLRAAVVALAASLPATASAQQPLEPIRTQLRLTQQGADGNAQIDASTPALAFASARNEYLLVWSGQDRVAPRAQEIYARRLSAAGMPLGDVMRLTTVPEGSTAGEPAVAYDALRDRYAVVYTVTSPPVHDAVKPRSEIWQRPFSGSGIPLGPPVQVSVAGERGRADEPDVVANALDDRFLVVWRERSRADVPPAGQVVSSVIGRLVDGVSGTPLAQPAPISESGGAFDAAAEPSVVLRATNPPYAVAWIANRDQNGEREVFGRLVTGDGSVAPQRPPVRLTTAGPEGDPHVDAAALDIVANPDRRDVLISFAATDEEDGDEIYVQRFADDLHGLGSARRVSSAGPGGSRTGYFATAPSVAYSSRWRRYLVTWQGNDDGRPGLSDVEVEFEGRVLDDGGHDLGGGFAISRMGIDGSGLAGPAPLTPAAVAAGGDEWLVAWSADDARPPMADEEYEIWGRAIGPNHDRDYDGSPVEVDCDDLDPRRRPGIPDVPDNGIDEDCSGSDNLDSDGDGSPRPSDCNDRNPFIRPGRPDLPGNGIDEDCSGRDKLLPTTAKVRVTWFFGASTTVGRLLVERARDGLRITLRCRGAGCPRRLRRPHATRVRGSRVVRLTRLFAGARLRAGATVEVSLRDPRAIGVSERYMIRSGRPPARTTRCLDPDRRSPIRCPR